MRVGIPKRGFTISIWSSVIDMPANSSHPPFWLADAFIAHPIAFLSFVAGILWIGWRTYWDFRRMEAARLYLQAHEGEFESLAAGSLEKLQRKEPELGQRHPIVMSFYHYLGAFSRAAEARSLSSFSVENNLGGVRRAGAAVSGWRRPLAGMMLLLGLVVTLINLQSSVGSLGKSFQDFGVGGNIAQQHRADRPLNGTEIEKDGGATDGVAGSQSLHRRADDVRNGMAAVATSASQAFFFGLGFILIALTSMAGASFLESRARMLTTSIQEFADKLYQTMLPMQSANLDMASRALADASKGLERVVSRLGNVATEIANLGPMVQAMSSASDAIKSAMDQLPAHLKSSMSTVSEDLVQGVTNTLKQTNDGIKQILAIYSQQQINIGHVRDHTATIANVSKQIDESLEPLADLPGILTQLQSVIVQNGQAQEKLEKTVERTNQVVQEFPVEELRRALEQEVKTQASFEELSASIRMLMRELQEAAAEHKTIAPQSMRAIETASQQVLHLSRVLQTFERTSALGVKGAYLAPLAEDTLRRLHDLESTPDLSRIRQGLRELRSQILSARDQALAQAAAVGGQV